MLLVNSANIAEKECKYTIPELLNQIPADAFIQIGDIHLNA